MVVLELLGFCLEVGILVAKFISSTKRKSSHSGSTSQSTPESLIREMEPRIRDIKTLNEKMGRPRYGNELIAKLEEGKELVRNRPKDYQKKLEKWEHSFRGLLSAVIPVELARDIKEIAFNTREIADNLKQIKELLLNKQSQSPSTTHLQLEFSVKEYNAVILNYKDCRERVKSLMPTSINQTKDEKDKDQREKVRKRNTETGKTSGSHSNIMHSKQVGETSKRLRTSTIKGATHYVDNHRVNKRLEPKNKTIILRKVVLAVLARDEAGKKIVEGMSSRFTGVISAERVDQPNKEKDLVIVKATKELVVQHIIEYLKKKLSRKNVDLISDTPWEEQ